MIKLQGDNFRKIARCNLARQLFFGWARCYLLAYPGREIGEAVRDFLIEFDCGDDIDAEVLRRGFYITLNDFLENGRNSRQQRRAP